MTSTEDRPRINRARYYGVRTLYFVLWYILLILVASGFFRVAPNISMFLLLVGFILLAVTVFSKPLGFWRKTLCLLVAAVTHQACYMLLLLISSFIVGQFSDGSMKDGMNALLILSKIGIAINIIAVIVAIKVMFLLQARLHKRLTKQ